MSTSTSRVPFFLAALLELLQARPGLTKVQVTWGQPAGEPQKEWLMLGNVDGDQTAAAMGRQRREEIFDHVIAISVLRGPGQHQKAVERAYAIAAEVEDQLRSDASVNSTIRVAQIKGPFQLRHKVDERNKNVEALLLLTVHCDQRI
jgi:hypothetical protein